MCTTAFTLKFEVSAHRNDLLVVDSLTGESSDTRFLHSIAVCVGFICLWAGTCAVDSVTQLASAGYVIKTLNTCCCKHPKTSD